MKKFQRRYLTSFFQNLIHGTQGKNVCKTVIRGKEQNLNIQTGDFGISMLLQYFGCILAKPNTFSRSWKPIPQLNISTPRWNPVLSTSPLSCALCTTPLTSQTGNRTSIQSQTASTAGTLHYPILASNNIQVIERKRAGGLTNRQVAFERILKIFAAAIDTETQETRGFFGAVLLQVGGGKHRPATTWEGYRKRKPRHSECFAALAPRRFYGGSKDWKRLSTESIAFNPWKCSRRNQPMLQTQLMKTGKDIESVLHTTETSAPSKVRKRAAPPEHLRNEILFSRSYNLPNLISYIYRISPFHRLNRFTGCVSAWSRMIACPIKQTFARCEIFSRGTLSETIRACPVARRAISQGLQGFGSALIDDKRARRRSEMSRWARCSVIAVLAGGLQWWASGSTQQDVCAPHGTNGSARRASEAMPSLASRGISAWDSGEWKNAVQNAGDWTLHEEHCQSLLTGALDFLWCSFSLQPFFHCCS